MTRLFVATFALAGMALAAPASARDRQSTAGPPVAAVTGSPIGNPSAWIRDSDFSAKSLRMPGKVAVTLTVGTDGRVAGCVVTASSGDAARDAATCRALAKRGRFTVQQGPDGVPQRYIYPTSLRFGA